MESRQISDKVLPIIRIEYGAIRREQIGFVFFRVVDKYRFPALGRENIVNFIQFVRRNAQRFSVCLEHFRIA